MLYVKLKTAYGVLSSLVGSEMWISDRGRYEIVEYSGTTGALCGSVRSAVYR